MKVFLSSLGFLLTTQVVLMAADAPKYQTSGGNSYCFKSREIIYPLEETFDALKQTLMQSNLNIATVTKDDGVLTAKGNQYNEDEDTIIGITLTIDFKEREKGKTSVRVIASYETVAKKNDTGQIGGAGISLPIPVPFTGKYTLVGQGNIDDSTWYRGFFNSLEKILFENHMKYSHIKKEIEPILVKFKEEVKEEIKETIAPVTVTPNDEIKTEISEAKPQEVQKVEEPTVEAPKVDTTTTEIKAEETLQPTTKIEN
ncbi:MAG: hypothetical protein PHF17_05175 [Arcobacteraceae bacterium]|nr:hypothetical protein [Arcobacteraceae bacterium]